MSSPYGAASGLVGWGQRLQRLPQQALDTVAKLGEPIQHGVSGIEEMLGMHQQPPAPQGPGLMTENAMADRTQPKPRMRLPVQGR